MSTFCFLDMDGVLTDFVGAICEVHGLSSPYANHANAGVFDMAKLWGMTVEQFWKPARGFEFWRGMRKTEEADEVASAAIEIFGEGNVAILSSPSLDEWCVPGKKAWVKDHYPNLASSMLFGSAKRFLAGSRRVLVDDRDDNIRNFNEHGGAGILFPRPWNEEWFENDPLSVVVEEMRRS